MMPSIWTIVAQVFSLLFFASLVFVIILIPILLYRASKNNKNSEQLPPEDQSSRTDRR